MADQNSEAFRECEALLRGLRSLSALPHYFQVSRLESISVVNASEKPFAAELMDADVFVGFSQNKFQSMSIALTEYVERKVTRNNSDFPRANEGVAGRSIFEGADLSTLREAAIESSLNEATERFVWANWWDHEDHSHTYVALPNHPLVIPIVDFVRKLFPFGELKVIRPNTVNDGDRETLICLYFLPNKSGVLSGGACGSPNSRAQTCFRALSELLRHAIALNRANLKNLSPKSFYDERLLYFGKTKDGTRLARKRLQTRGSYTLELPKQATSREINHSFDQLVILHQTEFKNQPVFIGGDLERLCL